MEMSDILAKHFEAVEAKLGPVGNDVRWALARLDELEQKSARSLTGPFELSAFTPGQIVINDPEVKAFSGDAVRAGQRIGVSLKAIISASTANAAGSAGGLLVPFRDATVPLPHRRLVMRDLMQVVQISTSAVQYARLIAVTNNAATVSETAGNLKPQSDFQFDLVTASVTTVAHFVEAMRQILDDLPQLQAVVDQELRYGLAFAEDLQILNGAGTGTDLNGVYTQATASTPNLMIVPSPTKIDVIAAAVFQQNLTNLPADGIVLHPADWVSMQLVKTTYGEYILGNPQDGTQPRLFGLPVIVTPAMTSGKFLVGCFQQGATLYDRMAARVEISTEDSDNFRRNKITILAEQRIALGVKNVLAFTKGDFAAQILDLTS